MKIASVLAPSACGGKWARSYVTSVEEPVSFSQYVSNVKNGEKKAIVSGRDSDSGDLSLPALRKRASRGVRPGN